MYTNEARTFAPLSRYKEWKDAGYFEGAVITDGIVVVGVDVTAPTDKARRRLAELEVQKRDQAILHVFLRFFGKTFWLLFTAILTLLVGWAIYKLKWK